MAWLLDISTLLTFDFPRSAPGVGTDNVTIASILVSFHKVRYIYMRMVYGMIVVRLLDKKCIQSKIKFSVHFERVKCMLSETVIRSVLVCHHRNFMYLGALPASYSFYLFIHNYTSMNKSSSGIWFVYLFIFTSLHNVKKTI